MPPKIEILPPNFVTALGSNITIKCKTTGIPQPVITWTKKNGDLPKNHIVEGDTLTILNMMGVNQGQYVCTSTNAAGYSEMMVTLAIEGI